jgi:hypothetical protein
MGQCNRSAIGFAWRKERAKLRSARTRPVDIRGFPPLRQK